MFESLISDIKAIVQGITAVKEVYAYPLAGNPTKYPAVIFFPDSFTNDFDTVKTNFKLYRFKMWVVVDLAGTTEEAVFTSILPKTVDKVVQAFDTAWNGGTTEAGHRIWQVIDSGIWGMSEEQSGKRAFAELTLTVKFSTEV